MRQSLFAAVCILIVCVTWSSAIATERQRIIDAEDKAVTEFARNQPAVLKEVGAVKHAGVAVYSGMDKSGLPTRYTVAIRGAQKTVYAEVNVSRSSRGPDFSLACVTHLWIGDRDPYKDVCAK